MFTLHPNTTAEGYWIDAKGNHIPPGNVKEHDKLEDNLVRQQVASAKELSAALKAFKDKSLAEAAEFKTMTFTRYEIKKGGKKGNMTLRTYDGAFEIQVAVADSLSFGVEIQAAKVLVDQCLENWSEGANENLRVIVMDAFQVNKEGKIDTGRILGLHRYKIEDDLWQRAMQAITDAVRVTTTKTYIRYYEIDLETGNRTAIPLDLAAV